MGADNNSRIILKYDFVSSFFGVKILSPIFIERYKGKCKVLFKDRHYDLDHEFVRNKKREDGDILEIELKTDKIEESGHIFPSVAILQT